MSDTEKITINLSAVDLGQIDLLVDDGFYSNRTDFIRTAIRNLMLQHSEALKQSVVRQSFTLGAVRFSRSDLERARAEGTQFEIKVVGSLFLLDDISPELALATIRSVKVFGVLLASPAIKSALADRIRS